MVPNNGAKVVQELIAARGAVPNCVCSAIRPSPFVKGPAIDAKRFNRLFGLGKLIGLCPASAGLSILIDDYDLSVAALEQGISE